ncbi:MAG: hypothetical protein AAGG72_01850, partial [Pseudomonadota bacterium]
PEFEEFLPDAEPAKTPEVFNDASAARKQRARAEQRANRSPWAPTAAEEGWLPFLDQFFLDSRTGNEPTPAQATECARRALCWKQGVCWETGEEMAASGAMGTALAKLKASMDRKHAERCAAFLEATR